MVTTAQSVKRVLVIDDSLATREAMSMVLAGQGYQVMAASNGADALQRLQDFELPQLILLDLRMPVMDGQTFCEKRRQDPRLASIPLVVLTALPCDAERATELGATRFLCKPVDAIELLRTVEECCAPPQPQA